MALTFENRDYFAPDELEQRLNTQQHTAEWFAECILDPVKQQKLASLVLGVVTREAAATPENRRAWQEANAKRLKLNCSDEEWLRIRSSEL